MPLPRRHLRRIPTSICSTDCGALPLPSRRDHGLRADDGGDDDQGYSSLQYFRAQGRLLIENERSTQIPGIGAPEEFYEDPEPYYQTQYKILKGRDLTKRVVAKLSLGDVAEFNGTMTPPATPVSLMLDLRRRFLALLWRQEPAPAVAEAPKPSATPDESALVSAFIGRVSVDPVRGSRLVDVSFDSMDPKFAARAANTLIEGKSTRTFK